MAALPIPRLSAWMPVDSVPLELKPGPLQLTLARCGIPARFGIANATIAFSPAVPATLMVVFVALMMASPLDWIRSPVLLLVPGLAALLMIRSSAVMVILALPALTPVVLAALTALTPPAPAGMSTMTPG